MHFLLAAVLQAQEISPETLRRHVDFLAGDDLEGRNSGYAGADKAAEYIARRFRESGLKPAGDGYFQPFEFSARTRAGATVIKARNCLAVLEGTDPRLKEEIIVLGAHYDHLGREGQADVGRIKSGSSDDEVWNGADDNASGVAALLEASGALSRRTPRRTILFIAFGAEEHGLQGSRHYADQPAFPIGRHAAMVNLHMIGRNPGRPLEIIGTGTSPAWDEVIAAAAREAGIEAAATPGITEYGDHASFVFKGIPAVHVFSGFHADYHRRSDHAEKIDYARLAAVSRLAVKMVTDLADLGERPKFTGRATRVLGLTGDDVDDATADALGLGRAEGGIRVSIIAAGSVAEKGGLQAGDVIVFFDGKPVTRSRGLAAFRRAIDGAAAGKDVPVVVVREGRRLELSVRWKE